VQSFRPADPERGIALTAFGRSAVSLFWGTVLVLGAVGGFLFGVAEGLVVGAIILLLVLPGVQLGAALVTALLLAVGARPDKLYQFQQLARIVLGTVAGTSLGLLLMVLLMVPLVGRINPELFGWVFLGVCLCTLAVLGLVALRRR
jgi:hypothetical protein